MKFTITLLLGFLFGSVLILSQAYSWYRIQEMFHFQSFHMFGLLFSAIGTAALFLWIIKKTKVKSINGNAIKVEPKKLNWKSNAIGGLIFGSGWAISGACSAPVYILVGMYWEIGVLLLLGALVGTFCYAILKNKLPQ